MEWVVGKTFSYDALDDDFVEDEYEMVGRNQHDKKKQKVFIVRFDSMMEDFDTLMVNLLDFLDEEKNDEMIQKIKQVAKQQRQYKSGHKYDLEKFELTKEQIQNDCKPIYKTFLN